VVVAHLFHSLGKVAAGGGITYAFHNINLYMYVNMYAFYQRIKQPDGIAAGSIGVIGSLLLWS
jgi:hypothetical protein